MFRFAVCCVLLGATALIVHTSFVSLLVGVVAGVISWLIMRGRDTQKNKDEWFWFVIQCTVLVAVAMFVVFKPDHGWIDMPSFVLRPSQELREACYSHTGGLQDPNWVTGSTQELGKCSGAAAAQVAGAFGRVLWAIVAGLRILNIAATVFFVWAICRFPLRRVRRRLGIT